VRHSSSSHKSKGAVLSIKRSPQTVADLGDFECNGLGKTSSLPGTRAQSPDGQAPKLFALRLASRNVVRAELWVGSAEMLVITR
jgi:hypothetical protein